MPVVDSESPRDMAGLQKAQSFAYDISSRGGSGRYYIEIRALSNNVDEIANGTWGPKSDILDTTVNAEKLGGILDSAADKSAAEAKELLTGSVHISAIQMAMQTDNSFRGQMKSLEEKYAAEQGITVKAPEVSAQAQKYVDPGRVQVVGAGLNVAGGSEVGLQMDLVQEADKVSVHDSYTKNVQLDISLAGGSQEIHELAVPVTVTMPVPQGLGAEKLVILHRHADGTMQRTGFRVNSDGTITFTLTSFSTFVFAEEGKGDNGSGENPGTPDNNPGINPGTQGGNTSQSGSGGPGYGDFLKNQIAAALPGSVVKVTKEQNMDTLSNSIMQQLVKRGDVALDMEYTYEGVDYHILIPAGMAVDNDIPWYGPLYLAAYFSFNENNVASPASLYIVQKGDTLSRIARTKNTTVARLAALNPQIKNTNHIVTGQIIQIQ